MYLFIYILVYLFSLLPWRLLYFISDIIALLLQHVFKYRLAIVQQNLAIAFPQKTIKERQQIANEFYQQFTDSFIETFKLDFHF